TNRHALHPAAKTECKSAQLLDASHRPGESAAPEVLIGRGDHSLAGRWAISQHPRRVLRAEEPGAGEVTRGLPIELAIRLGGEAESPCPVTGLNGLVKGLCLGGAGFGYCGPFGIVDSRGQLELGRDRDVAMTLGWWAPDPRLSAYGDISKTPRVVIVRRA